MLNRSQDVDARHEAGHDEPTEAISLATSSVSPSGHTTRDHAKLQQGLADELDGLVLVRSEARVDADAVADGLRLEVARGHLPPGEAVAADDAVQIFKAQLLMLGKFFLSAHVTFSPRCGEHHNVTARSPLP